MGIRLPPNSLSVATAAAALAGTEANNKPGMDGTVNQHRHTGLILGHVLARAFLQTLNSDR
jgi:hypothetical protein